LYGFSIMKESLEKAIYRHSAKVKREHGFRCPLHIVVRRIWKRSPIQILQGVKAQVAILSIERDAQRLKDKAVW